MENAFWGFPFPSREGAHLIKLKLISMLIREQTTQVTLRIVKGAGN